MPPLMDCRTFRKNHVAFIDDTLPGVEMKVMRRHLGECSACASHDTGIRRSLLLFKNLPAIQPSADFATRLNVRLAEERARLANPPRARRPSIRTFFIGAAGLAAAGIVAINAIGGATATQEWQVAPVIASRPAAEPTPPVASPALVASMSTGVPVWSVMYLAEQAPMRFARAQFKQVSWGE
jgi:anti-sigma factor RsiW